MTWISTPYNCRKQLFSLLFALASFTFSFAQNPIVTENALAGNPYSEWGLPDGPNVFKDERVKGFATQISVNSGESVHFKIDVPGGAAVTYTVKIYRIGYYQGNGARLVANLNPVTSFTGTAQPSPIQDISTGLIDCGNWSESASWDVPANAVSGLYIANLESSDGGRNHIVFIVRNDVPDLASGSDILLQFPDATWQAYNTYGGNSLYNGTAPRDPYGQAAKVSYNRPFFINTAGFSSETKISDWYMNNEYPMIRWLERNGYDVTYTTNVDAASRPEQLLYHKIFISLGHDEYWSKEQRDNVTAARDAGVHLAFFSGNEVYWKTRWENSIDGANTPYRTLVCYKEGVVDSGVEERACGDCDPTNIWTGLWRIGSAAYGGAPDNLISNPENELTGQASWYETSDPIQVPSFYKKLRFWRNTSISNLAEGQTATLAPNTLGYEWDWEQYPDSYPQGRITMSSTTLNNHTHKLSLYRHSSGALVFGAGTIQWSWGLDSEHFDNDNGNLPVSKDMQQATVNLFADMDVQPATMQVDLTPATKSTDVAAPVSAILSPVNDGYVVSESAITITGDATDAGGGVVAGVEVSTDGGVTWHIADINTMDGNVTWSYSWAITASDTFNIKSRGFDDSGNKENPGTGINIIIGDAVCPCTIFQPTDVPADARNDGQPIEVGVKFRSSQNGYITGIRFYKAEGDTGTHIGHLWSSTGMMLAEATFINESDSGWQQALFTTPVAIIGGTTYVASYFSSSGDYVTTNPFFTQAVVNGPLHALANGEDGPNGVYIYSATSAFPTNNYETSNYSADVVFTTAISPDVTPPTVFSVSPVNDAADVSVYTSIVANFDEVIDTSTVTNSTFELRDAANTLVPAAFITADNQLILIPEYALNYSSSYTATIKAGVKDLAGNTSINDYSWTFTTVANTDSTFTIFQPADTPADIRNDGQPIEVGVRFRSIQNGYITGIRFYKGAGSTGTHIGHLWSNTGTMLAEGTFINESDSGWQQVSFTTPVAIAAGTTYIASYFSSSGDYVTTNPFFTQAVVNGPLRALANGEDGPNGVYVYSATSAFPTNNYESSNYWADVVFATGISPDVTPPTIFSVSPVNGAADVSVYTSVTANFDELIDASAVTNSQIELRDASNTLVPAAISTVNNQVILIPTYSLNYSSSYTATIKAGVRDLAGNTSINNYSWTFTTVADSGSTFTIFQSTDVPADPRNDFGQAIEVGVKFRSAQNGYITGIRFYKGAGTTGTYIGHLWSSTGTMLAEATFTNESDSGWQQVSLATPVAITAGTTYIASYFSSSGDYVITNPFFTQAVVNGPLRALASGEDGPNGVYIYSETPAFPINNFETSNYWADVIFATSSSGITAPVVTTQPVSQSICLGNNVNFNSDATGTPAPTIQWQVSMDGIVWTNINGATNSTLTFIPTIEDNNKQYRAVWTNSAGSANSDPAILTVNAKPAAPVITVVDNCGNSVLTASNYTGTFLWSNGETTSSITVTNAATYSVIQTLNGCTSAPRTITSAPKALPAPPTIYVLGSTEFCEGNGLAILISNASGSNIWSTGATSQIIVVTTSGSYTVRSIGANGCSSLSSEAIEISATPIPAAPIITIVNNCGNSVLTASGYAGTLLWSNGATTPSITVTNAATYTVRQTVNGCTSATRSATSAPKAGPASPTISVVNNCGNSVLTASGYTGTLLWSNGATSKSITVTNGGTYTVTQTVNGCASAPRSATAAPKATPPAPNVTVVNNCGNSVLTASGYTGTLLWSNGATTPSITVTNSATYTVRQTVNGCTSATRSATSAPKATPPAPNVTIVNNCGNSVLTASGYTGTLLWSNGATSPSITVTNSATYTVRQTVNGCTSATRSATSAPKALPAAPTISVSGATLFCQGGFAMLTSSSSTGNIWSTGATSRSIFVNASGSYTVRYIGSNGCSSPNSAPRVITVTPGPVLSGALAATVTSGTAFSYTPASTTPGTTFTWSRALTTGISNPASSGSGSINQILVNTTNAAVNVMYVYKLTANGCTNTQNVVVTVVPAPIACTMNSSISVNMNSSYIPEGRNVWLSSVFDPSSLGTTGAVNFYVTNSKITATVSGQPVTINIPDSRIRFDANVTSATTQFINDVWQTQVPLNFNGNVFMGGLAFESPGIPGGLKNVIWSATISSDRAGVSITRKWAAAVYTNFSSNAGLNIKAVDGNIQNPYANYDKAGTPENYKQNVVSGGTGYGGTNYTGNYSNTNSLTCSAGFFTKQSSGQSTQQSSVQTSEQAVDKAAEANPIALGWDVKIMPNPSTNYFTLVINGNNDNPATVRVLSVFGQVVEKHEKISAKTALRIGQALTGGTYFAEIIQGDQRKVIKIIKVN